MYASSYVTRGLYPAGLPTSRYGENSSIKSLPLSSLRSRCGRHNVHGIGVRITLSENATTQFGEWPHMCAVLEKRDGVNHFVCGASLIDDGIIMTSAHYMQ